MKLFSKQTFKIIIGIVLTAGILVILNRIFMPKYVGEYADGRITAEFYNEKTPLDVIVVGTSVVYASVSPAVLWDEYGYTSYVRANSSQAPWESYYMIKNAFEVNKPKLVMLDMGFFNIEDDYYEDASVRKNFDYMPNSLTKYKAIKNSTPDDYKMWDFVFPILRYHDRWNDLSLDDVKYFFKVPPQTHNGHIISLKTSEELEDRTGYDGAPQAAMGYKARVYLDSIISICRENKVELILYKTPSLSARWDYDYDNKLASIASDNGILYINYDFRPEEIDIDFLHDSDDHGVHLNTYGAEKFTRVLGNDIKNIYGFESHKNDSIYSQVWDVKLMEYEAAKLND